jgi:hypothetical protein
LFSAENRTGRLHFKHKHPLFRAKETEQGIWWENSLYYLWFACLQQSEMYLKYCDTGKGQKQVKAVHKDFGDIRNTDFKTWWHSHTNPQKRGRIRGAFLFAEPRKIKPQLINPAKDQLVVDDSIIYIALPANTPESYQLKQTSLLIKESNKQLGKKLNTASLAKYPISEKVRQPEHYKRLLKIIDLKQQKIKNTVICDRLYGKADWYKFAKGWMKREGLLEAEQFHKDEQLLTINPNQYASEISRALTISRSSKIAHSYKKALRLVHNAACGTFPNVN